MSAELLAAYLRAKEEVIAISNEEFLDRVRTRTDKIIVLMRELDADLRCNLYGTPDKPLIGGLNNLLGSLQDGIAAFYECLEDTIEHAYPGG